MSHIRFIQATDFAQWLPLWQAYQHFYQTTIDEEITQNTFARFLDNHEPIHALVLENESKQLIGLVHYIFHLSTWTKGRYCYLQDLYVQPAYQKQGMGRQLIEGVYQQANLAKCARVYWLTQEQNIEARLLYDRIAENSGFIQYRKIL